MHRLAGVLVSCALVLVGCDADPEEGDAGRARDATSLAIDARTPTDTGVPMDAASDDDAATLDGASLADASAGDGDVSADDGGASAEIDAGGEASDGGPSASLDSGASAEVDSGIDSGIGSGSDSGIDSGPPPCPAAAPTRCAEECVDAATDERHCSACGTTCGGAATCWTSACGYREFLHWVNVARASARTCGTTSLPAAPALTWSARLETASQRHANDMAARHMLTFTGSDSSTPVSRVTAAGYAYNFLYYGIFVMGPSELLRDVVDQMLLDPGICAAMMSPMYTELGAGAADGSPDGDYWAWYLGQPR